jgi:hypothetical protein
MAEAIFLLARGGIIWLFLRIVQFWEYSKAFHGVMKYSDLGAALLGE